MITIGKSKVSIVANYFVHYQVLRSDKCLLAHRYNNNDKLSFTIQTRIVVCTYIYSSYHYFREKNQISKHTPEKRPRNKNPYSCAYYFIF